uniref:Uncharacterized protein n=2 Tax=Anopheles gambiae TaxID=7165 RepID=A0A1S4HAJ4_ANOGA
MKKVIILVVLGLFCENAVQANDNEASRVEATVQSDVLIGDINVNGKTKGVEQSGRIINGVPVSIEIYKFAVSLRVDNRYYCGGSIISVSHVLSAGHCVYPFLTNVSRMSIYGGSTSPFSGGISIPVIRAVNHPDYNPNPPFGIHDFDVAVLTVPRNALRGRPNMAPIAIQNVQIPAGTRCYVVGWGWTDFNARTNPTELHYLNMAIVSQDSCASAYSQVNIWGINSNMICAKGNQGTDTCKGDSGSALVCGGRLTGISSFTSSMCKTDLPAGLAKLTDPSIRSFICKETGVFMFTYV